MADEANISPCGDSTNQFCSVWKVGARVSMRTQDAHLYEGTHWAEKLALPRCGTILEVPLATQTAGQGTVLVEWDSLTGQKGKAENWQRWMHTDRLEACK